MMDSIYIGDKQLIVTGDRILVSPRKVGESSSSGFYVHDPVADKRIVMSGWVEAVGPGNPPAEVNNFENEPWEATESPSMKHYPPQVEKGDQILYVNNTAWEIQLETGKYFLVPFSSLLLIMRTPLDMEEEAVREM